MSAAVGNEHVARRRRQGGFALVELLVVVAIIAVLAGGVIWMVAGVQDSAETKIVQAELAEIRKACLRFNADMGEPPRYLAELMQSPDGSVDSLGGWWWRTDSTPAARLRSFDPATGRGWNGPYIKPELTSSATQETRESRLNAASAYEPRDSDESHLPPNRLAILISDYSKGQMKDVYGRLVSHYQLDLADATESAVRFVQDPTVSPAAAVVVARLGLGLKVAP